VPPGAMRGLPPTRLPPVIGKNPNHGIRFAWIFSVVATLAVVAVSLFVTLRNQPNLNTGAGTGTTINSPGATAAPGGSGTTGPPATSSVGVNMFDNPQPAFDAFANLNAGTPPRVHEVIIYDTWAVASVEVPGRPDFLDDYEYNEGQTTGPEPTLIVPDQPELEQSLFTFSDIDPAVIPGLYSRACIDDGSVITHVIINRDLVFDDGQNRVKIYVYSGIEDRMNSGGYVSFATDGTEIDRYC
jgi:hypothetical protein